MLNEDNIFLAIANDLVRRGEDMRDVAKQLGQAFRIIVNEGTGTTTLDAHQAELTDLTSDMKFLP